MKCFCYNCLKDVYEEGSSFPVTMTRMIVCPDCGNKRCPRATDHNLACTNSNEVGQYGSRYGGDMKPVGYWMNDFYDGAATIYEVPQESFFARTYKNLPLYSKETVDAIFLAISNAGFTLVKTVDGYQLKKFENLVAQTSLHPSTKEWKELSETELFDVIDTVGFHGTWSSFYKQVSIELKKKNGF